jgi:hypothetical protein
MYISALSSPSGFATEPPIGIGAGAQRDRLAGLQLAEVDLGDVEPYPEPGRIGHDEERPQDLGLARENLIGAHLLARGHRALGDRPGDRAPQGEHLVDGRTARAEEAQVRLRALLLSEGAGVVRFGRVDVLARRRAVREEVALAVERALGQLQLSVGRVRICLRLPEVGRADDGQRLPARHALADVRRHGTHAARHRRVDPNRHVVVPCQAAGVLPHRRGAWPRLVEREGSELRRSLRDHDMVTLDLRPGKIVRLGPGSTGEREPGEDEQAQRGAAHGTSSVPTACSSW